ncbi:hypothetical protein [Lacinutrix undariae]
MDGSEGIIYIVGFALRIIGAVVCSDKAKKLKRNSTAWGFGGFFFPIIAMIWVHCIKAKINWDKAS